MSTQLAKAYVQIVPSAKGLDSSLKSEMSGPVESVGTSIGARLGSLIVAGIAAAGIGDVIKSTVSEGAALEQSLGGTETLFKESADIVIANAERAFHTAGMSQNAYMENVTAFAASLVSSLGGNTQLAAEYADMAMTDISDNANKMGTDMDYLVQTYQSLARGNYAMLDNLKLGYGGTKAELERLLADATALSGIEYSADSFSDIVQAIHVVQDNLGITGTTAEEAATTVSGSLASMKAAYSNFLGNLALGRDIEGPIKQLVSTTSTFLFDNLFPMIGRIVIQIPTVVMLFAEEIGSRLKPIGGRIVEFIVSGITTGAFKAKAVEMIGEIKNTILTKGPELIENGKNIAVSIGTGIITKGPELIQRGKDLISHIESGINEKGPGILEKGREIVTNIANAVQTYGPGLIQSGADLISNLVNGILDGAPKVLDTANRLIGSYISGVRDNAPKLISEGGNIVVNLVSGILERLPEVLDAAGQCVLTYIKGTLNNLPAIIRAAGEVINSFLKVFIDKAPDVLLKGAELVGELIRGIGDSLPDIADAASEVVGNLLVTIANNLPEILQTGIDVAMEIVQGILDSLPDVVDAGFKIAENAKDAILKIDWIDVGVNIIKGIIKGIYRMDKALAGAAIDVAKAMLDGLKGFLGIASPAKKGIWVGEMLDAGFAKGIEDNTDLVEGAVSVLSESSLNVGSIAGSPVAAASRGDINISMTVNGSDGQSESEIAERVIEELKRILDRERAVYA